jgi:AraC-like DNA-binding protein
MIRFECDYATGAHPKVMEHLMETNLEECPGYGTDEHLGKISEIDAYIGEIYKAYVEKMKSVPEEEAVDTSDNAVKIIKHINDHLFEQLSLKEISEMFYISQSQLNRIFRRATGSPVWEYITIKRLIAARSQIQKGLPAGKVCTICGFKDYSSFYRLYKERFGVSPKQDCKIQL